MRRRPRATFTLGSSARSAPARAAPSTSPRTNRLGRTVAVKILGPGHPRARASARSGSRAKRAPSRSSATATSSRSTPPAKEPGIRYLAMEYVPGLGPRRGARGRRGRAARSRRVSDVVRWGIDLANALECAHDAGHRAPRREALEHPHRGGRPRGAARLRHRPRRGRRDADRERRLPRLAAIRVARAGGPRRRRGRRALRRLLARRHALRAADRRRAVPRADAGAALPPDPPARTPGAPQARAVGAARPRDARARDAREGPRGAGRGAPALVAADLEAARDGRPIATRRSRRSAGSAVGRGASPPRPRSRSASRRHPGDRGARRLHRREQAEDRQGGGRRTRGAARRRPRRTASSNTAKATRPSRCRCSRTRFASIRLRPKRRRARSGPDGLGRPVGRPSPSSMRCRRRIARRPWHAERAVLRGGSFRDHSRGAPTAALRHPHRDRPFRDGDPRAPPLPRGIR